MSAELAYYFAQMLAAQARVAGMQAENQARALRGEAPNYYDDAFFGEAATLERLAQSAINCRG